MRRGTGTHRKMKETMKKSLILLGLALVAIVAFGFHLKRTAPIPSSNPIEPIPAEVVQATPLASPVAPKVASIPYERAPLPVAARAPARSPEPAEPIWTPAQLVDILAAPQSTYQQKQSAWKGFRDPRKLDEAIVDLEERTKNEPQYAEYPALLGRAYLQKAGITEDVREQAILGMKADQTFDAALSLDSSHWEARFMKAVGMSYWPAQMNKGPEVIERFTSLIQDQERQTPQPQFAQPYIRLGEEYRKAGQLDLAQQVWQRGASFYPENPDLQRKLASAQ